MEGKNQAVVGIIEQENYNGASRETLYLILHPIHPDTQFTRVKKIDEKIKDEYH